MQCRLALTMMSYVILTSCESYAPKSGRADEKRDFKEELAERESLLMELSTKGMTLEDCVAFALEHNLDLRIASLEASLSESEMAREALAMLPSFGVQGRYQAKSPLTYSTSDYLYGGGGIRDAYATAQDKKFGTLLVDMAWSPIDFGLAAYSREQARLGLMERREHRRRLAQLLVNTVTSGYVLLQTLSSSLPALEEAVQEASTRSRLLRGLYEKKLVPLKLFMDARELFTQVKEEHRLVSKLKDETRNTLAGALGVSPTCPFEIPAVRPEVEQKLPELPELPELRPWLEAALTERPELYQADFQTEQARLELKKDWLRILPNVSLFGNYLYDSNSHLLKASYWSAGIGLTQDLVALIFNQDYTGPARSRVEVLRAGQKLAALNIFLQIRLAHIDLRIALDRATVGRELWQEAVDMESLTRKRVLKGEEQGLELRRARLERARAWSRFLNHRAEVQNSWTRLRTAAGLPIFENQSRTDQATEEAHGTQVP